MSELIRAEALCKSYPVRGSQDKTVQAVDHVSLSIQKGETFGLVGESGSGKTTLGRTILRLIEPDSGRILYAGDEITHAQMAPYRKKMQIIFQNPAGSLDPSLRVWQTIAEGLTVRYGNLSRKEKRERSARLLAEVGLGEDALDRFPSAFSGGQQQRIDIARALSVEPEFIVCDEPVSALDVSYQAQIINMLVDLQDRRSLTYLFISHDLSVVMHISQRIGVMYQGRLVEVGSCEEIARHAAHPYTRMLMEAIPYPDPEIARQKRERKEAQALQPLPGPSSEILPKTACPFYPRCRFRSESCLAHDPVLKTLSKDHASTCVMGAN